MHTALHVLLAILVLAPEALPAQAAQEFQGTRRVQPWPADLGGSGAFGRSAAGDLDLDGVQDAVLLDGDRVVVLLAPGDGFAPSELALAAADADVLPGAGPAQQDAVLAVSPQGLHLAWIDLPSGALQQVLLEGGAWAGARAVRAADLDGDGVQDVVGLSADAKQLLLKPRLAGPSLQLLATQALDSAHPVRDLVALRFDGDAAADLALLSDWGVEVLSQSGALLGSWPAVMPGGVIARLGQDGALRDRLVWVTTYAPPAQQWLMVLSTAGVEQMLDVGALDATSLQGADYDADGDDDLMIGQRSTHDLVCLVNQRSEQAPAAASFVLDQQALLLFRIQPVAGAAGNTAWPALADFDGDGDLDVVQAVEEGAELHVLLSDVVAEDAQRPGLAAASYTPDSSPGRGTLHVVPQAPPQIPPGATHLEALVWRQQQLYARLDQVAVDRVLVPLAGGFPAQVDLELTESGIAFDTIHVVSLRLVALDAAGHPIAAHPAWFGALAFDDQVEAALAADPTTSEETPVPNTQNASGGSGGTIKDKKGCGGGDWGKNAPPVKSSGV